MLIQKDQSKQKYAEETIRSEFEITFSQRVHRYLEIGHHGVIANPRDTKFAPVSSECINLFRDGHFYGCISLTQTVTEALAKFLCTRNNFKPAKDFERNVKKLFRRNFIDENMQSNFLSIWKNRDDYHHLNNSVENEKKKLEAISRSKIKLLAEIEKTIFAYSINNGKIIPKHPKYWDMGNDHMEVFLRHPYIGS